MKIFPTSFIQYGVKNIYLAILLILSIVISVFHGATPINFLEINPLVKFFSKDDQFQIMNIFWDLRIPRVIFSAIVGLGLGYCGALTQGLFRNNLADPGLLGISAGAAAAAAFVILFVFSNQTVISISVEFRPYILPLSAFIGALIVCYLLNKLAELFTNNSGVVFLLIGLSLNAIIAAWLGLCAYIADDEQLRNLSFWTLGTLSSASWLLIALLSTLLIVSYLRLKNKAKMLNALSLGNDVAMHVGINVSHLRKEIIAWIALLNGFVVAWCGMISFIGLIAPNMARLLVGADQKKLMPTSMLIGSLILVIADALSRNMAVPAEIPVGIFTALLGGPIFLILILKQR